MAHQCPDCWQVCYCGGDIDDICFEGTDEEMRCNHCLGKEPDDSSWDDFDVEPDHDPAESG